MKVMITGAAGFIGRTVARWIAMNEQCQIYLVDDLTKFVGDPLSVSGVRNFVCLSPAEALERVGAMDGGVIHLGALSSTAEHDLDALVQRNYLYSRELTDAAVDDDVPFVLVSSAGVYGNDLCRDDRQEFSPLTPYAATKAMADSYVLRENGRGEHGRFVARPFNVYGAGEITKPTVSRSMLYRVADAVAKSSTFSFHSPNAERDYVYVGDVAIALRNLLGLARNEDRKTARRAFDIGTCRPAAVRDVVAHAVEVARRKGLSPTFVNLAGEDHMDGPYQRFTKASWNSAYPFESPVFLGWMSGLEMLVEHITMGVRE
jgi:nucleoside-diphosphate-sugar epimerase